MPYLDQAKTLFQLQSELLDAKVDIAVNKAINQVVEQMISIRQEISDLRHEMHREIGGLQKDMAAVKERLGMRSGTRTIIQANFIRHSFQAAGWLIAIVASYALGHAHALFL